MALAFLVKLQERLLVLARERERLGRVYRGLLRLLRRCGHDRRVRIPHLPSRAL
jgi:hypothetical protein